jgi:hypothetical protein
MDTLTKRPGPRTFNKCATLDWPSPDMLMAARRARAEAVRGMTLALWQTGRTMAVGSLAFFRSDASSKFLHRFPWRRSLHDR